MVGPLHTQTDRLQYRWGFVPLSDELCLETPSAKDIYHRSSSLLTVLLTGEHVHRASGQWEPKLLLLSLHVGRWESFSRPASASAGLTPRRVPDRAHIYMPVGLRALHLGVTMPGDSWKPLLLGDS